jgi:hypothetical protein
MIRLATLFVALLVWSTFVAISPQGREVIQSLFKSVRFGR